MSVFRNRNFVKRDYECTNVVAAVADEKPAFGWNGQPADYWEQADETALAGLEPIGSMAGVKFYGYL